MGLKLTFTLLGILVVALLTAPIRYVISQFLKGKDLNCKRTVVYKGQPISKRNVYNFALLTFLRKHPCKLNVGNSEKYFKQAVKAFKRHKVNKAKSLVEHSILIFPDERKLLLIGELNLISANQRYRSKKNRKFLIRDYKYSRLKFQLAERIANTENNSNAYKYSKKRIRCINRMLKTRATKHFCGGYRKK